MDAREYMKLKGKLEQWQREQDKAAGALEQLMKKLKKDFGCRNLKQAKKLLKKKEMENDEAKERYKKAKRSFDRGTGKRL